MEQLVESAKAQHNLEKQIREMDPGAPLLARMGDGSPAYGGGPGDVFVKSVAYQRIADPAGRGQTWTTGPIEVSSVPFALLTKGTLLETTAGGPGGGMVPPFYEPGVVSRLFEPLAWPTCSASRRRPRARSGT